MALITAKIALRQLVVTIVVALSTFLSVLSAACSSSTDSVLCSNYLVSSKQHAVQAYVTAREFKYYLEIFNLTNPTFRLGRGHGIPEFQIESVVNGQKSLLSLGEGISNFILDVMKKREVALQGENSLEQVLAVDISYSTPEISNKFLSKIPKHLRSKYVAQPFQELNLRNSDGKRIQFDEAVSSWSLVFVAEKMLIIDPSGASVVEMLKKVLLHIKPGGVLRLWPVNVGKILPVLFKLKADGLISEHIFTEYFDTLHQERYQFLALKKPTDH